MPGVLTACSGSHGNSPAPAGDMTAPTVAMKDGVTASAPEFGPPPGAPPPTDAQRDVVKTASMTITVANTSEAADKAAVLVEKADGRVDSRSEDAGSNRGLARTSIVLRVPVAKLDGVVRDLKTLGTVQIAETKSEDVTSQRVDLDARMKALQTSVDRLLAIMRDAKDPDALIKAEGALSQRQADLDSLRAQRDQLGDRIDYSTVDVTFVAEQIGGPAPQKYEGFTGQIERGWDALVRCWATWFCSSACCCHGWARWPLRRESYTESSAWRRPVVRTRKGPIPHCRGGAFSLRAYEARRMPRLSKSSRSDSDRPPQMP